MPFVLEVEARILACASTSTNTMHFDRFILDVCIAASARAVLCAVQLFSTQKASSELS